MASKRKKTEEAPLEVPKTVSPFEGIVGEPVMAPLTGIVPNTWNPVVFTEFQTRALLEGMKEDGWLASQALLVWGTDETGSTRNVIIDGEHRFLAAQTLGLERGPVVFLHGISEARAKALTIKINSKRGTFDEDSLALLMKELQLSIETDDASLAYGFDDNAMARLLAETTEDETPMRNNPDHKGRAHTMDGEEHKKGEDPPSKADVRMCQLYFNAQQHTDFMRRVEAMKTKTGLKSITDVVAEAMRIVSGEKQDENE